MEMANSPWVSVHWAGVKPARPHSDFGFLRWGFLTVSIFVWLYVRILVGNARTVPFGSGDCLVMYRLGDWVGHLANMLMLDEIRQ
jgi:hypothetical protein